MPFNWAECHVIMKTIISLKQWALFTSSALSLFGLISCKMRTKGNGYYAKLLGKERLVMSLSDTVCRAKPNSGDITVLVHQETDTTFSSIITNMQSGKDPRIMLRYDCKYRILTIGKLMLDESFMPQ
jgi:hypothetical protein